MTNSLDKYVVAYQGNNVYDFDNEIILTWYPERILRHVGDARSLLELGLGHGYTANIFSKHFARHVVLEGSPEVIRNFRHKNENCSSEIVETYFETFNTDERFDVISMGFILEHVDDPLLILRRFRNFLAPNGKLFVAVPNAEGLNRRLGHLAGMLSDLSLLSEHDLLLGHQRYYTVDSLRKDIMQAGWTLDWLEGIYLKPLMTSQMISLNLDEKIIQALCEVAVKYPELSCAILAELSCQAR